MKRALCLAMMILFAFEVGAKSITDMVGTKIEVKESVTKAFSASPPMMVLMYVLSPETMVGVNFKFYEYEKSYMLKSVADLPVLGGFFGSGKQANLEKLVSLRPDVVFVWDRTTNPMGDFTQTLAKFDIPVVQIRQDNLADNQEAIILMGKILGKEDRAEKLVAYANESLARVKKSVELLGDTKKQKVFFAQGIDGLTTECAGDMQSEIITIAGGVNVHSCNLEKKSKREKITLEKLYTYDPDIIFVREGSAYVEILDKKSPWRNLKAYKEGRIYLTPTSPFAWLTRPPSLMRFLGLPWMHKKMYPEHFNFDDNFEIKRFYELFLHVKLNDSDIEKLLRGE